MELSEALKKAVDHYLEGTASEQEKQLVNDWFYSFNDESVEITVESPGIRAQLKAEMSKHIHQLTTQPVKRQATVIYTPGRWWAAAAALLVVAGVLVYRSLPVHKPEIAAHDAPVQQALPGSNHATLTLSSGKVIVLDHTAMGQLAREDAGSLLKPDSNQLVYKAGKAADATRRLNQVTVPFGSHFRIVLSDGTKVWLNAGSSLQYPSLFTSTERKVSLVGEAYFEVAADRSARFTVSTPKMDVQVLGTHFNINAYPDENVVIATLLKGSVRVAATTGVKSSVVIKPGEQALLSTSKADAPIKVSPADAEESLGWMNNRFWFNDADLADVMRQIARWYDVEVVFTEKVTQHVTGSIPRHVSLSKALEILSRTSGAHYILEGRKVVISRHP